MPTAVHNATQQYLLDTSACGIYGVQTPWAKTVQNFIVEQGSHPEAKL
jgi:hypothetical protein